MTRLRLDTHTHTGYSRDSRTPLDAFARAAVEARLDVVCVTDHDTIDGALELRERAGGFRVIVGEEISTRDGDLIGLFLERAVQPGLSAEETIARVRDQGGLVSVPHPFSRNRRHRMRRLALERIRREIDLLEVFNARELSLGDNARAAAFAAEHGLAGTVGSDAHRPWELGRAYLEVDPFGGPAELVATVRTGTAHGRLAGVLAHALTRYDVLRRWLSRTRT